MVQLMYKGPDTDEKWRFPTSHKSKVKLPAAPGKSNWALRTFKTNRQLSSIPDIYTMKLVGDKNGIQKAIIPNLASIQRLVRGTPSSNFAWAFYGSLEIENPGGYLLCTSSDDGSRMIVDGELLVNNDGLHGRERKCRSKSLSAGHHQVVVEGFNHYGAAYQRISYRGPDTGNSLIDMLSVGKGAGDLPSLPPPSKFLMRMYAAPYSLSITTPPAILNYVGEANVDYLFFRSLEDFRQLIPKTPSANYEWAVYGTLNVHEAGRYTFCTTSDDGSLLLVDDELVVDNDNPHGPVKRCGSIQLKAGMHQLHLPGFQQGGGVYLSASYSGPDTGNVERALRSDGLSGIPKKPESSEWLVRMYKSPFWGLTNLAEGNPHNLDYVGETKVKVINYHSNDDFMRAVPGTPDHDYAWEFIGAVAIEREGRYSICTTSDDGSAIYLEGNEIANDDGLHGGEKQCGSVELKRGNHNIRVVGFQHYGGAMEVVTYSGPDTFGHE
eukprot:764214-Hanusia_phi.AAC.1